VTDWFLKRIIHYCDNVCIVFWVRACVCVGFLVFYFDWYVYVYVYGPRPDTNKCKEREWKWNENIASQHGRL